ncbi:MAG: DUF6351 family protein, partial [Moraxellaceae bacterium]|nr:DUF6351 family protein [Moraxellaceae bacterium]
MHRSITVLAAGAVFVLLTACGSSDKSPSNNGDSPSAREDAKIVVLSNRADMLSAGDALIEIIPGENQTISQLTASLNGADISNQIALRENQRWMGRITGMKVGDNLLRVRVNGRSTIQRTLRNFPNEGPIFSGPQVPRLNCQEGGEPLTCNQPAEYTYLYKSSQPWKFGLQPYDPANPASDVATTTTDHGVTVPFIVRQELGYQDRDQYR